MLMTQSLASKQTHYLAHLVKASHFLKQFLKNPMEVGSLIPSSRFLASVMLEGLARDQLRCVIEYGPGNGSFTSVLEPHLNQDAQFFAIEPNKFFADQIQLNFPRAKVIRDYADRTHHYLGSQSNHVDLVISGLPFSLMDWDAVESTILETYDILKTGGAFRTFVYWHMSPYWKIRRLKTMLESLFKETTYKAVVKNFPPAFVISCTK